MYQRLSVFIGRAFSLRLEDLKREEGQTTVEYAIVLALVLAILRALTSQHYFVAPVTASYGFVIGWFAGWMAKRRQARR